MSITPFTSISTKNALMNVRTYSIAKVFEATLRRNLAESAECGDGNFKAVDVCPETKPASTGKLTHKSLQPPPEVTPCIFRRFGQVDEPLGPGADKCGEYKNAEYYGYHIYSYTDILVDILKSQESRVCPIPIEVVEEVEEVKAADPIKEVQAAAQPAEVTDISEKKSEKTDECKVQMVCCLKEPCEKTPCKLMSDEQILASCSDNEASDDESDCQNTSEEGPEDKFCKKIEDLCKCNKALDDEEC